MEFNGYIPEKRRRIIYNAAMRRDSKLSEHKKFKKELKPPFSQIKNFKESSWINDRLPEMLWAILLITHMKREDALDMFRTVVDFVHKNKECFDITQSGIAKMPTSKMADLLKLITLSDETKNVLRPMLLLSDLPAYQMWKKYLPKPVPEEDWNKLADAISKTLWHQSEEATDCRWAKYLCKIIGTNIKFSSSIQDIDNTLRGVFEYPNFGDLRHIRPFIRAGEIFDLSPDGKEIEYIWSNKFWKFCLYNTKCIPEELVNKEMHNRQEQFQKESKDLRQKYFESSAKIRNDLITHFFNTSKTSSIDSRHEGAFGISLYAVTLFIEIIFYRSSLSITGRTILRTLLEAYITFQYLLKKETTEPAVWDTYRIYGTGQLKLIYLKLKESNLKTESIDLDQIDSLANEDRWIEFTPINLGNWDSENLRKISEIVGLKDLYDKYYDYTSGFTHLNWGSVRESVFQKCVNPLHRFHRVPNFDLPLMPSILDDCLEITNKILESLANAYPKFEDRISPKVDSNQGEAKKSKENNKKTKGKKSRV